MFSAPGQLLESMPGTLMITDCLEACQSNDTCGSVNYETGLCVLFSSNADKLPGNEFVLSLKINEISLFAYGFISVGQWSFQRDQVGYHDLCRDANSQIQKLARITALNCK